MLPRCCTTCYANSFFPACARVWNTLNCTIINCGSVVAFNGLFRNYYSTAIVSETKSNYRHVTYGKIGKLLTQFGLGLSPLKHHLFLYNIIENPFGQACRVCFWNNRTFLIRLHKLICFNLLSDLFDIYYKTISNRTSHSVLDRVDILCLVTHGVNSADANITTVGLNSINANVLIFRVVSNYISATKCLARNDRSYCLFVYLVFLLFVDAIESGVNRDVMVLRFFYFFISLLLIWLSSASVGYAITNSLSNVYLLHLLLFIILQHSVYGYA